MQRKNFSHEHIIMYIFSSKQLPFIIAEITVKFGVICSKYLSIFYIEQPEIFTYGQRSLLT